MNTLLEHNRAEIDVLCRRYGVARLAVFGSALRDDFDADSDVDFLVEFADTKSRDYVDRYLDLAVALEQLLGRKVDLVTVKSVVNPIFREVVFRDKVELYAA